MNTNYTVCMHFCCNMPDAFTHQISSSFCIIRYTAQCAFYNKIICAQSAMMHQMCIACAFDNFCAVRCVLINEMRYAKCIFRRKIVLV